MTSRSCAASPRTLTSSPARSSHLAEEVKTGRVVRQVHLCCYEEKQSFTQCFYISSLSQARSPHLGRVIVVVVARGLFASSFPSKYEAIFHVSDNFQHMRGVISGWEKPAAAPVPARTSGFAAARVRGSNCCSHCSPLVGLPIEGRSRASSR